MNLYPVTIVENFYEDPNAVRIFALNQKYQYRHQLKDVPYVFPGARTKDLSVINKPLFEKVSTKIVSLFYNSEFERMRWAISTNFQSVSRRSRCYSHGRKCCICRCIVFKPRCTAGFWNFIIQTK